MARKNYLSSAVSTRVTPQSAQIPGSNQVKNSAGGFAWAVSPWTRLERFLILGAEGGTYYTREREFVQENAQAVIACIKENGQRAVDAIAAISDAGRAPDNDPALFALALAITHGDVKTKQAAGAMLPKVARTGTHLFHFCEFVNEMRGWGPLLTRVVGEWYQTKEVQPLSYQMVKYQSRDGWSHQDILRLAHPKPMNHGQDTLFKWAVGKMDDEIKAGAFATFLPNDPLGLLYAIEAAKTAGEDQTVALINQYNLPREGVKTEHLKSVRVWDALLQRMPPTALIRNLGNMTALGLIAPNSDGAIKAIRTLTDVGKLKKARVHPLKIYLALVTYKQGKGMKGGNTWTPVQSVVDALEEAFYLSFDAVVPTNLRYFLGLDVSGSMGNNLSKMPISCREGTALLSMVTLRTEPFCFVGGFRDDFQPLKLTAKQNLDTAVRTISGLSFGSTDCAQPMVYAMKHNIAADVFVIYTDNETWVGDIHPKQALDQYRQKTGIAAKSVVVGMTASNFSIADPNDAGMLDVAGFDTRTPSAISGFVGGQTGGKDDEDENEAE